MQEINENTELCRLLSKHERGVYTNVLAHTHWTFLIQYFLKLINSSRQWAIKCVLLIMEQFFIYSDGAQCLQLLSNTNGIWSETTCLTVSYVSCDNYTFPYLVYSSLKPFLASFYPSPKFLGNLSPSPMHKRVPICPHAIVFGVLIPSFIFLHF